MGARSKDGPWAMRVLRLIEQRPGVLAARLAKSLGMETVAVQAAGPTTEGAWPHREPGDRLPPVATRSRLSCSISRRSPSDRLALQGMGEARADTTGRRSGAQPDAGETLDAISGHFRIYQLKDGHRFSTDDVLTAWYGTTWVPAAHSVLDLGSGIGSVGMIAAWRLPGARFVTVEAQAESVGLARRSCRYNGLEDRYEIREGDFRDGGVLRDDERFDLVLGSPPYFPRARASMATTRKRWRAVSSCGAISATTRAVAGSHLAGGGFFACVFPEEQRPRLEAAAAAAGLVVVRRRPVVFREGEPPLITLFGMMRAATCRRRCARAPGWSRRS